MSEIDTSLYPPLPEGLSDAILVPEPQEILYETAPPNLALAWEWRFALLVEEMLSLMGNDVDLAVGREVVRRVSTVPVGQFLDPLRFDRKERQVAQKVLGLRRSRDAIQSEIDASEKVLFPEGTAPASTELVEAAILRGISASKTKG